MVRILFDRDFHVNLSALQDAWGGEEAFALISEKTGVSASWIKARLSDLPADLAEGTFSLLTSGSTGQPKLVVGSKTRAEALVRVLHDLQDSEPVQEALLLLPVTHCFALINQWLWAHVYHRQLIPTAGFAEPDILGQRLTQVKNAQLCLVRTHVTLLENYFSGTRFSGVIRVHFAGSRFPQERIPFLRAMFPHAQIYNNYGCTEAMPRLALRRAEDSGDASDVGRPMPGVHLMTSETGELLFRSPFSAVAFVDESGFHRIGPDDWVGTGDLGELTLTGICRILGRCTEVFKRHGDKISLPLLLETVSLDWSGQSVFYLETDSHGETGHVLVLSPSPSSEELRRILQAIRKRHPRAHWPLRIESVESFPLLPNAKIDRVALPNLGQKSVCWSQRIL